MSQLDIIIPVYNEGENIVSVLDSLHRSVRTPFRVLVCYDHDADTTLPVVRGYPGGAFEIVPVKNRGRGVHGAVRSGFEASQAPAVLVLPADDPYNAGIIDLMVQQLAEGCEIVAASRLMKGGCMRDCPWLKAVLVRVAAFTLHHLARVPTHDATSGFRLFSRRVLDTIEIESSEGFTFSIELLVKCHRLGWRIGELPAVWFERRSGASRFRLLEWLPAYLRWYLYAFETTYCRRRGSAVKVKSPIVDVSLTG